MHSNLKHKINASIKSWTRVSTFHALPKLVSPANSTGIKLMWTILAIASISLFIFMSARQLSDFLTFDVTTKINIINEAPIAFPTVTVCNINPFTSSLTDQVIDKLIDEFFNGSRELNDQESDELMDKFVLYTANPSFGDENRRALGRSLEETVVRCSFNYRECGVSNFSGVYMRDLGYCWQFNDADQSDKGESGFD